MKLNNNYIYPWNYSFSSVLALMHLQFLVSLFMCQAHIGGHLSRLLCSNTASGLAFLSLPTSQENIFVQRKVAQSIFF